MKNKISLLLIAILLLSGFIYFYQLNRIPPGFYVDEASVSYNAYSILKTGKDAFGQPFPILFRLLGSYTPPLFIYISSIFIYFFGMEPWVFRSISAISTLVSTLFLYLLIQKMDIIKNKTSLILTLLFYAISPWLIFNARHGYEVTLAYLLFNIAIYLLYLALIKPKYFIWSSLVFSLSTYTAHTQRYLAPIFLVFFLLFFRKIVFRKENLSFLKKSLIVLIISQIPNLLLIGTPAFWVKNERLFQQPINKIFSSIINQFFAYLSAKNLFYILPDIDLQHTIPEISVMYNFLVIPFFIGIFILFTSTKKDNYRFLALFFVTSLIPAIFSGQFISIQRALPFLFPLIMVIGLGMDFLQRKIKYSYFVLTFSLLIIYSFAILYRSYFILFTKERENAWNYGYFELTDFIKRNPNTNFLVDNTRNPRNYILILYYLRYPPSSYQKEVNSIYKEDYYRSLPPENSYKFSNIEVRGIDWERDPCGEKVIIGDSISINNEQASEHNLLKIYSLKGSGENVIFQGFKTNPKMKCK